MKEQEENIITIPLDYPCAIATEHGKKMFEKLKEDWEKMKEEEHE